MTTQEDFSTHPPRKTKVAEQLLPNQVKFGPSFGFISSWTSQDNCVLVRKPCSTRTLKRPLDSSSKRPWTGRDASSPLLHQVAWHYAYITAQENWWEFRFAWPFHSRIRVEYRITKFDKFAMLFIFHVPDNTATLQGDNRDRSPLWHNWTLHDWQHDWNWMLNEIKNTKISASWINNSTYFDTFKIGQLLMERYTFHLTIMILSSQNTQQKFSPFSTQNSVQ